MQTSFTLAQLADPDVAESEKILRACVHCGFCIATCPTYVLDGNELDSPRGRIYLIKEMLEHDRPATADVTTHIDRCLSCLACMTTCPSGVHYMHLVDHARTHIEETYRRPLGERLMRWLLANVMPYPRRFQFAIHAALFAKPLAPIAKAIGLKQLAAMLQLSPSQRPHTPRPAQSYPATGASGRKTRVALLAGCVNDVLAPQFNDAAIRLLTRHGVEVVVAQGAGCCGSLVHHLGRRAEALAQVRANIDAWSALGDIDAIVITASGCGTTVKDYGFMLREDKVYAERAARVAKLTRDISEYLVTLPLARKQDINELVVAYHSACSLQHGQRVTRQPKETLTRLGFVVKDVPEGHLCCGSAGTYNILQSDIARRLRERKVGTIERLRPDVIAAGNLGCIMQIAAGTNLPVVHTVELIDWATGGPCPPVLREHRPKETTSPAMAAFDGNRLKRGWPSVRCEVSQRASAASFGVDRTNFESVKDREVDHGEEEESEETVHQKEGRSGPQATEGNEGCGEAVDQEKVGPQGCPQAPLGAETRSRPRRTGAGAVLEPTERLWRRWRYRRLVSRH